eukprot:GHVO01051917.1.p1 GENE.GHVO01051917.1~~GHVO01051917.1.p1  ORF type:complete len:123 (-),score=7.06 GHVO01051917.1:6-374(-)
MRSANPFLGPSDTYPIKDRRWDVHSRGHAPKERKGAWCRKDAISRLFNWKSWREARALYVVNAILPARRREISIEHGSWIWSHAATAKHTECHSCRMLRFFLSRIAESLAILGARIWENPWC